MKNIESKSKKDPGKITRRSRGQTLKGEIFGHRKSRVVPPPYSTGCIFSAWSNQKKNTERGLFWTLLHELDSFELKMDIN